MDEKFSESKEEAKKEDDSNIEWKKSGIGKHERLTLKVNTIKAISENASKENDFKAKHKVRAPIKAPKGFIKINKKIKDIAYNEDEDEDEEYSIFIPVFEDVNENETSLMKALTPEEKVILKQKEDINNVRLQENVGKDSAIEEAERIITRAGLSKTEQKTLDEQKIKTEEISIDDIINATEKQSNNKNKKIKNSVRKNSDENKEEMGPKERARKYKKENKEELNSIKQDEKSPVEHPEVEIGKIKEKPAEVKDKVNQDTINKDIPHKDELEKDNINKDTINKEDTDKKKKARDLINEKSGRNYETEEHKQKQPQEEMIEEKALEPGQEQDYQKLFDAKLKQYQDRYR